MHRQSQGSRLYLDMWHTLCPYHVWGRYLGLCKCIGNLMANQLIEIRLAIILIYDHLQRGYEEEISDHGLCLPPCYGCDRFLIERCLFAILN